MHVLLRLGAVTLIFVSSLIPVHAETATLSWTQRRNLAPLVEQDDDSVRLLAVDHQGSTIVVGHTWSESAYDLVIMKFPPGGGAPLWKTVYNSPNSSFDDPYKMALDPAGDIFVTGFADPSNFYAESSPSYVAKYSGIDGRLLWRRIHDGSPEVLSVDSLGSVTLAGEFSEGLSQGFLISRFSSDGTLIWEKKHDIIPGGRDIPMGLASDSEGDVLVVGKTFGEDGKKIANLMAKYSDVDGSLLWVNSVALTPAVDNSVPLVRLDSNDDMIAVNVEDSDTIVTKFAGATGSQVWREKTMGIWEATGLALDGGGNIFLTGLQRNGTDPAGDSVRTVKYSASGSLLWKKLFATGSTSRQYPSVTDLAVDSLGDAFVIGASIGYEPFFHRSAVLKYSGADGALLWQKSSAADFHAIILDSAGTSRATGNQNISLDSRRSHTDFYLAALSSSDGDIIWECGAGTLNKEYQDKPMIVKADASGNAIVLSISGESGASTGFQPVTRLSKYSPRGALLWDKILPTYYSYSSYAKNNCAALAANGDILLSTCDSESIRTTRYSGIDGAILWQKTYDGIRLDAPNDIALDASGNVIVTGHSQGADNFLDLITLKYAGGNGELLWTNRREGSTGQHVVPVALAIDASGNIAVTGGMSSLPESADCITVRYSPEGAVLWERIFHLSSYQYPTYSLRGAIAANASGDIFVAVLDSEGSSQQRLLKYASDGTLLWQYFEPEPSGSFFINPIPNGLALDTAGNPILLNGKGCRKFASADGGLLWERALDEPSGYFIPAFLKTDAEGNPVIGGDYASTTGWITYQFNKYSVTNGTPLWNYRHSVQPIHTRRMTAMTLDATGNVLATGYVDDRSRDEFTLKLAVTRNLTNDHDEDGDGLPDLLESQLVSLGLDWQTPDPEKISVLRENAHLAGLFARHQIHTLRVEPPRITRDASGMVDISLFLKQSPDGAGWSPLPPGSLIPSGNDGLDFIIPQISTDAKLLKVETQ